MLGRRKLAVAALACAAAACGGGSAAGPPEHPTVLQDDAVLLGEPRDVATALDDLRELGVDWVRVTASWSAIAPEPESTRRPRFDATDPDAYPRGAWDRLDRVFAGARERGMEVSIDIGFFAPRWAVSRRAEPPDRQRYGIDVDAYADFAEAVASRYPEAVAFTIWNEPNFPGFFLPQWRRRGGDWVPASPHAYRAMLEAAVPRVEEAAPDSLVLVGGTSSIGTDRPDESGDAMQPVTFLLELACVDERLDPLGRPECRDFEPLPGDGYGHHPLSIFLPPWEEDPEPGNVRLADLERLTRLLDRLHRAGRTERELPVYVTEYGYQTDPPDPTQLVTPAQQARYLAEAERITRETPGVASYAQFLLRDLPEREGDTPGERWRDSQMGLRFPDGRRKPAQRAFAYALSARAAGARAVSFWVHVRAADEPRSVRIAERRGGRWRPVADAFETDDRGLAERTLVTDPRGTYRVEAREDGRWVPGVAIPVRR